MPHFIQFSMIASGNKVPLALGRGRVRAYSRLIPEFHWHGWKSIKCCHFAVRVTAGEKKCIAFLQRHGFKFDPKYVSDGACNRAAPPQATHRIRPAQCFKVGRGSVVVLIVTHPSRGGSVIPPALRASPFSGIRFASLPRVAARVFGHARSVFTGWRSRAITATTRDYGDWKIRPAVYFWSIIQGD